jgi:hypothetical protein
MNTTTREDAKNPSAPASPAPAVAYGNDPDEINLLEYAYALVRKKWLLVTAIMLGLALGYLAALLKGPRYRATAIIAPREAESQKAPNLSGLGMFGGLVASQMNLGGNASLEYIDVILESRKFNIEAIERYGLLPFIFAEYWDSSNQKWEEDFKVPPLPRVAELVNAEYLEKEIAKNNTMTISMAGSDSIMIDTFFSAYLAYLDNYIRANVQREARENRDYLEQQLIYVTDPLLRAKIQELIANEVEKMMVVSKEAFRVLDPPYVLRGFKEKKLFPIIFAVGFLILTGFFILFSHTLATASRNDADGKYLEGIKQELRLPFTGKKIKNKEKND